MVDYRREDQEREKRTARLGGGQGHQIYRRKNIYCTARAK